MQTRQCPPALPKASISAGAKNHWLADARYFAQYGDVYRVFAPEPRRL